MDDERDVLLLLSSLASMLKDAVSGLAVALRSWWLEG